MTVGLYIFDMGGVVSRGTDVAPLIAERLGISREELLRLSQPELEGLQAGKVSPAELWERFSERSGIRVTEELWGHFFKPRLDPDVVVLIRELGSRGRVVCGTNTIEPHYDIHLALGDYSCFSAVYASHLIGLVKPDPAFFLHILEAEGVEASEAFFTDDVAANVDAARRLGIDSVLFTGAKALRAHLFR